ncbi:MAG: type II toxin-antitoxin system HicA family toxin [Clostridia bacterium]|nr:type II toxin-antitoxin system HicA family toxin [Clostridia bacterium]
MTPKEFVREAQKLGWYLWEHGTRHDKYRHPTRAGTLTVERHNKDLATGTLHQLKKIAGMK